MANNITNKDLQQNVFQEGGTHDAAPVTYRPVRPVLPIGAIVTPAATLPLNSAATNKVKQIAALAPPADSLIEMNFRGVWQSFVTYNADDVVIFNGSAYLAILANSNAQPDLNHDTGVAEGSGNGSNVWTLISENFVFNASLGVGAGWGSFSAKQLNNTSLGNAGVIGPITTSAAGQIGFLVSCQSTDNVQAAGWTKIFADGFADGAYVKTFPTISTINDTIATSRAAQLLLFNGQWSKSLTLSITSVKIVSNVVTCQCVNNFLVGTQVLINGLTGAGFLNGQTFVITAVTPTSFQFSFTHADYGPTADSGSATNLPYLQYSGLITGASGQPSFTFPSSVKAGSVLIVVVTSNDTNYVPNINSISSSRGDSFTVLNSNGFISGSAFSANIAYVQIAKGGSTTINITVNSPSAATKVAFFEMPGAPATYIPYDVFEFHGAFFVCLKETQLDAFGDPNSWGQLSQGPGGNEGQIQFNSSAQFNADSNLFWDNLNKRLGIGTETPVVPLDVIGEIQSSTIINVGTGYEVAGGATSGHVLRGNGTNFVDAALAAEDLSNGTTGTGKIVEQTSPSIASPTLTGVPVAPTPSAGDSSTKIATTAFVANAVVPALQEVQGTLQTGTVTGVIRLPGNIIPPKGIYRVVVYMEMAANPGAGNLDAQIGWTSLVQARTASNGQDGMPSDISTAALNFSSGTLEIVSDGIHDITYTITLT